MTDLDNLIAAVEVGAANHSDFASMFPYPICDHAREAQSGSLDAAKALHEALLPGCEWNVDINWANVQCGYDDFSSSAKGNPSRAWLLSILKAYRILQ